MTTIELTQGYQAFVDDDDYSWVSQWIWYAHVKKNRRLPFAYAVRKDAAGNTISMAVEIAKRAGIWVVGCEIDHRDTNRLNNMRYNLRAVTGSQNQANQIPRPGTSKYKGVSWDSQRELWRADIRHNYKRIPLGRFVTEKDAAMAYDQKALELFGEYARLNFPP